MENDGLDSLRQLLNAYLPREARMRYYEHRGWMYAWTTERVNGRFMAAIYNPEGRRMKYRDFAKRMTAKATAGRWMERARATASGRPPASLLK